jgi:hypothetical protein
VTNVASPAILPRYMPRERDVAEQERLDRIERHIKQLSEASAALQVELQIARQLAATRAQAVKSHTTPTSHPKRGRKNR